MTLLLIDTDPGTDDAIALLMALHAPRVQVAGITTVGGNARLAHTTRNALRLLEYARRREVPVVAGAARPLRGRFRYAYDFHGRGGLGIRLPRPATRPQGTDAPAFLANVVRNHPQQVTLVALGPLTNVARLFRRHPREAQDLRRIVVMGGVLWEPGNITPHAEFNIFNDPLAARMVLESGLPLTLVPLDVCRRALVTQETVGQLRGRAPAARLAHRILAHWLATHPQHDAYDLCDPLAMAVALDPGVMPARTGKVSVEVQDPERLGKTTFQAGPGAVAVPQDVDLPRFWTLLRRLLRIP